MPLLNLGMTESKAQALSPAPHYLSDPSPEATECQGQPTGQSEQVGLALSQNNRQRLQKLSVRSAASPPSASRESRYPPLTSTWLTDLLWEKV